MSVEANSSLLFPIQVIFVLFALGSEAIVSGLFINSPLTIQLMLLRESGVLFEVQSSCTLEASTPVRNVYIVLFIASVEIINQL